MTWLTESITCNLIETSSFWPLKQLGLRFTTDLLHFNRPLQGRLAGPHWLEEGYCSQGTTTKQTKKKSRIIKVSAKHKVNDVLLHSFPDKSTSWYKQIIMQGTVNLSTFTYIFHLFSRQIVMSYIKYLTNALYWRKTATNKMQLLSNIYNLVKTFGTGYIASLKWFYYLKKKYYENTYPLLSLILWAFTELYLVLDKIIPSST